MIGVFDSGVGGLIIYKRIKEMLPWVSFQYFSDHIHFPYGGKTDQQVIQYSMEISSFLVQQGCKMIVVACNTATVTAIQHLREKFSVPFVGIVPAVKPASTHSTNKKIAVLVTPLSAKSKQYEMLLDAWKQGNMMDTFEMPNLASIVEYNQLHQNSTQQYLHSFFQTLQNQSYSIVVLGCTHFLFLKTFLEQHFPNVFEIVDPIEGVAKQARRIYLLSQPVQEQLPTALDMYYTSDEPSILMYYLKRYLYLSNPSTQVVSFEKSS
jgi:glutamate racemase